MNRVSPPSKGWVVVLLVGVCLLPFSPIIALIGMFVVAWLLSQPSIFNRVSFKTQKQFEKEEREKLSASENQILICPTCGAVYTKEFVTFFKNEPKCVNYLHYETKQNFPRGSVENCETNCFYCDSPVFKAHEMQGFYESQANTDDLNVLGRNDYRKPLRFVRYVLQDHPITPNKEMNVQYEYCVRHQIMVLYAEWVNVLHNHDPNYIILTKENEKLRTYHRYAYNLRHMIKNTSREWFINDYDAGKYDDFDIWYKNDKPE